MHTHQNSQSIVLPATVPGFEHVKRLWDSKLHAFKANIKPGEFYVTTSGEIISTVLGSCISVCVRDRTSGIGGMNHFMLPQQGAHHDAWDNSVVSESARYGDWAMEKLLNALYKLGAMKNRLEIKVFGGGNVLDCMTTNVGEQNIKFAKEFLKREGFAIDALDVGDIYPRKVVFFTKTGKVKLRKLTSQTKTLLEQENRYAKRIISKPGDGEIELF